jgi:hypothetical protein
VDLVLQGHDHAYIRTKAIESGAVRTDGEGTVHLESGGSSSKQENAPAPTAYMAVTTTPGLPSYSVITVTDRTIDVHTVVVRNPITSPAVVDLQSAGTTVTPSGSTIDFAIMAAPGGLAGAAPTTYGGVDGKITGTTSNMEYKPTSGGSWTDCAALATGNLASGTYAVRYKALHDSDTLRVASVTVAPGITRISTRMRLSGVQSVKVRKSFKLSGTITPSAASGRVEVVFKRYVGGRWRTIKTGHAHLAKGRFSYSYTPNNKGKWRAYVTYAGVSPTPNVTYMPSSSTYRAFTVK